jgi:hypothetical protein
MTEPTTTRPIADAVPPDGAATFSFTISQPAAAIVSP